MSLFQRLFRDQAQSDNIDTLSQALTDDFDYLCSKLSAWSLVQHNEDGTHSFISSGYDLVPIGGMIQWPTGVTIPTHWVNCNGGTLSRAANPLLFKRIGISQGAGDGLTTFNVPNVANFIILADR